MHDNCDIVILGGQSNCEGCGLGEYGGVYVPDESVWELNRDLAFSIAAEREPVSFSLAFARLYRRSILAEGRRLLLIRAAVGGTGFSDRRWGMGDDLYLHMLRMTDHALGCGDGNRLVAFLWHQGETDAENGVSYDTHCGNLSALVNSVRERYDRGGLPFVAGDFVQEWKRKHAGNCAPVIAAIRDVCASGHSAFAETDGLTSNDEDHGDGDDIHFSRRACYELGERYFKAYRGIDMET